jgi:hypothetical protein
VNARLDERFEFEGDDLEEEQYEVTVTEINNVVFRAVDFDFSDDTPIWCVLDEVSLYFEDLGYDTAVIHQMSTIMNDDDTLTLTVIYVF